VAVFSLARKTSSEFQTRRKMQSERRASGRLRQLNQRVRISGEKLNEFQTSKRNARLEQLENDNFIQQAVRTKKNEEEDFIPVEDAEEEFSSRKRKKLTLKRKADRLRRNQLQSFSAVLENEYYEAYPSHVPTILTISAQPSIFPRKHFCSVCGYFSNYTCTRCGIRFCSTKCNHIHQETRCLKWTS